MRDPGGCACGLRAAPLINASSRSLLRATRQANVVPPLALDELLIAKARGGPSRTCPSRGHRLVTIDQEGSVIGINGTNNQARFLAGTDKGMGRGTSTPDDQRSRLGLEYGL